MVCRKTTAALRSRWTAVNSFHGSSSTVDKHWLCLNLIAPGFGLLRVGKELRPFIAPARVIPKRRGCARNLLPPPACVLLRDSPACSAHGARRSEYRCPYHPRSRFLAQPRRFGMTLFLEYTSILRFCWVFIGEHFLKWLDMTNYVIEKRCRLVVSRKGIFRGRCSGFRSLTI